MPEEEKKGNGAMVWGVVVLVIALAGFGGYKYMGKSQAAPESPAVDLPVGMPEGTPTAPTTSYMYKDGTYSAKGSYNSPAGAEEIDVTLVLKDDVVTDVTVKSLATVDASKNWQGKFISGVKSAVVGKKLSEVTLTKVSGSSLTPKGWNDAVAKIMVSAKA